MLQARLRRARLPGALHGPVQQGGLSSRAPPVLASAVPSAGSGGGHAQAYPAFPVTEPHVTGINENKTACRNEVTQLYLMAAGGRGQCPRPHPLAHPCTGWCSPCALQRMHCASTQTALPAVDCILPPTSRAWVLDGPAAALLSREALSSLGCLPSGPSVSPPLALPVPSSRAAFMLTLQAACHMCRRAGAAALRSAAAVGVAQQGRATSG